jgi:hypothetical protein
MGNENRQIPPVAGTMLDIRERYCQAEHSGFAQGDSGLFELTL